jgi:acyl carrier protein
VRDIIEIQAIVFRAIDRVNEVLPHENVLAKDPALKLLGDGGALDSMGFVNFVVALEEELAAQGLALNLVGELNDTRNSSLKPFTVSEFIDFVFHLLQTKASASS